MASALDRLIHDDALWGPMADAALVRARDLSWSAIARRCLDLYRGGR
jgi:hypothetical protein